MQARMNNPAQVLPDALSAILALGKATESAGVRAGQAQPQAAA